MCVLSRLRHDISNKMSDEESSSASDVDYIPSGKKEKNSLFSISVFNCSFNPANRYFNFFFKYWRDLEMKFL